MNRSLRQIFSRRSRRSAARRAPLGVAEQLERRSMLTATFLDGVLTLTGTEAADVIVISPVKESGVLVPGAVRVRGVADVPRGQVFDGVESVVINSLGGNDRVQVGTGLKAASGGLLGVTVDAGTGNDIVNGGDGDDRVVGGSGRDTLRGGRGDDDLDGGIDDDLIQGGDGDDLEDGGAGRDRVFGGRGDDTLYGGTADDRLFGELGDDDLDGEEDDDALYGGPGNDDDVDDDDGLRDMSRRGDDGGDNENLDEDENGDLDDDDGDFEDDDETDDDGPVGTPIQFDGAGAATLTGTSTSKRDKVFYSFVVAGPASLSVTMLNVANGRYPDLEIERQGDGAEVGYEMEPSDGGPTSDVFSLPAGTYSLRLRSPDLNPVDFSIALLLT